ncbi:CRISPR-associated helicase/endonuclease Cas3 [Endozoicomonas sp. ONNA2]|uniref:CRISPR-associated helicase/endonuclease Cas3 n=1 Tax=Endozoicomonas sp. ONNA2 TaxID=2828741 RepID=UPI002148AE7D|nr:CRISPR-associated helicase/endonuclease Cas3 [Endozoicomonas sp. ONNA2]
MSIYHYWGKANKTADIDDAPSCHLLPYHCLDVAAVAHQWWACSASLRRCFTLQTGLTESRARAWLLFFIALHDYGKFDLRFQLKAANVWRKVNPELSGLGSRISKTETNNYWHGPAAVYWFYHDWQARFSEVDDDPFFQSDEDNKSWEAWFSWLAPVAGHHGSIAHASDKEERAFGLDYKVSEAFLQSIRADRQQWLQTLEQLFLAPAGLALADDPPPLANGTVLAGFCSVADWLGSVSGDEGFSYDDRCTDDLRLWFERRLAIARRMLEQSGILGHSVEPYPGIAALLNGFEPRQVQCLVDTLPLSSGLSLIEASTGSGKTEAALAYAWRLLEQNLADSIIFALPTQATANAMLGRLEKIAPLIFKGAVNTVLAHGRARFQQDFINLRQAGRPQTCQGREEALVQCANWLAESKKRVFLGQVGVCTVDQVLVSVLPLRHKFVRGFGIGRSVLIVDEVHAYDTYMYGLLNAVLKQQRAAGGSAILLSATLPQYQKQQLLAAWEGDAELSDNPAQAPYPLITHVSAGQPEIFPLREHLPPLPVTRVKVELRPLPSLLPDDCLLERMIQAAEAGARVCLVCNLVDVAQHTVEQLREKSRGRITDDQLILFHSRFIYRDRARKEALVLETFGPESKRDQGHILVSTQVFECSIDADMDWMITQLCPVDLLFQRWGRLHRHCRPARPEGFAEPLCTVLLPTEDSYDLHRFIYKDSRILWRTRQLLEKCQGVVEFPKAYRTWVEPVYKTADWGDEPEWVMTSHEKFIDEQLTQRSKAKQLIGSECNDLKDTDSHVAALTRDGEMSVTVVPVITNEQGESCLLNGIRFTSLEGGERFEQISLNSLGVPASWKNKGALPEPDDDGLIWLPMVPEGDGYQGAWGSTDYIYHGESGFSRRG